VMFNIDAGGVMLTNKETTWSNKSSFNQIFTILSIPTTQLPFNVSSCTASDYKEFSFVGIDAAASVVSGSLYQLSPGLQGGVYADVPCGNGDLPFYYTEFGWQYPLTRGFAINPGDVVGVNVQAFGESASASVYIEDTTSQIYSTYSISTPGIVGENADWLVFRPCCAGSVPYPLANSNTIFFGSGFATNGAVKSFYPGSQVSSTYLLEMMDDGGDQIIEQVEQGSTGSEGESTLTFSVENCAQENGCTP
jgi:hypothetical protein